VSEIPPVELLVTSSRRHRHPARAKAWRRQLHERAGVHRNAIADALGGQECATAGDAAAIHALMGAAWGVR